MKVRIFKSNNVALLEDIKLQVLINKSKFSSDILAYLDSDNAFNVKEGFQTNLSPAMRWFINFWHPYQKPLKSYVVYAFLLEKYKEKNISKIKDCQRMLRECLKAEGIIQPKRFAIYLILRAVSVFKR